MSFEPRFLTGNYENDYPSIVELFETMAAGLRDGNLALDAGVLLAKLNMVEVTDPGATTVALTASAKAVPHGLGSAPLVWIPMLQGDARVWEAERRDSQNLYLQASTTVSIRLVVGA